MREARYHILLRERNKTKWRDKNEGERDKKEERQKEAFHSILLFLYLQKGHLSIYKEFTTSINYIYLWLLNV